MNARIGTAGWSIPPQFRSELRGDGSLLASYSRALNAVEINTSFYRDHKPSTYIKWADETPDDFRFAVKLSRIFTHERKLQDPSGLRESLRGIMSLENKLGALLIQLPPSLLFASAAVSAFLSELRSVYLGPVVWEPRHRSWTGIEAMNLLSTYEVDKVIADPEPCPVTPGVATRNVALRYFRLHGTPVIYKSLYSPDEIAHFAAEVTASDIPTWVIFDNTTFGFATENALELSALLASSSKLENHILTQVIS